MTPQVVDLENTVSSMVCWERHSGFFSGDGVKYDSITTGALETGQIYILG